MPSSRLQVLYEDNHLLAVNKPAGLPTMGVSAERESVLSVAKAYLKEKYRKPGNVYLGVVSRLDAPVTGVLLMARTSKAASRLSAQFRERHVTKRYHVLVSGEPESQGTCHHWLRKDERHRKVHVTMDREHAQEAKLSYRVLQRLPSDTSYLEVTLETGRKHQIRVQLAAIGHPVLGDRKYGSRRQFGAGIALHAHELQFRHPVRQQPLQITASKPKPWSEFLPHRS